MLRRRLRLTLSYLGLRRRTGAAAAGGAAGAAAAAGGAAGAAAAAGGAAGGAAGCGAAAGAAGSGMAPWCPTLGL